MRRLKLVIGSGEANKSVKSVLISELVLSTSMINRIKQRETGLMLNGVRVHTNETVREGDVLVVEVGDELPVEPVESVMPAEKPELVIRYSDEDLIILEKPAGVAVHPTSTEKDELTLKELLAPELEGASYHPVNRLDRGTTGLMVVAKSGYIHDRLRRLLHTEQFQREYVAVVEGTPSPENGVIDLPIARETFLKRCVAASGQPAVTRYETVKSNSMFSLLRVFPQTGRTHQIRVHLSAIGCPLAGDWLYGHENKALIPRPALHASRIILVHPVTNTKLDIRSSIPEDMEALLAQRRRIPQESMSETESSGAAPAATRERIRSAIPGAVPARTVSKSAYAPEGGQTRRTVPSPGERTASRKITPVPAGRGTWSDY